MISVVQNRNLGPTRVLAGNFDRILDRFRSGVHQNRLLGKISRRVFREQFTHRDVGLIARNSEQRVGYLGGLVSNSGHHGIVGVTHGHHTDTAGEVNKAVAIDVFDDRVVGVCRIDGEGGRNTCGHGLDPSLVELS